MRSFCFVLFCLFFASCNSLLFPKKIGPVSFFKQHGFSLPDTILSYRPFYIYRYTSNRLVNRPTWVGPPFNIKDSIEAVGTGVIHNEEMLGFEKSWDSLYLNFVQKRFKVVVEGTLRRSYKSNHFQLPFKYLSVPSERMSVWSPPTEAAIGMAAWTIKQGMHDSALSFLPPFIIAKSHVQPILVASFFSSHLTVDFLGVSGQGFTANETEMVAIASMFLLKDGEVVFYKNAATFVHYKDSRKRTAALAKITSALFE